MKLSKKQSQKIANKKIKKKHFKDDKVKVFKTISFKSSESNLEKNIQDIKFDKFFQFFLKLDSKSNPPVLKQVAPIKDLEQIPQTVAVKTEDDKTVSYKEGVKGDYTGRQEYQSPKDRKYSNFEITSNIGQVDSHKDAFFRNPETNPGRNENDNYQPMNKDYQKEDVEKRVDHRKKPLREGNF